MIQRITDANEAAIAKMMEIARPRMEEGELWIEMAKVLITHTADYPARLSLGSNNKTANASNSMGLAIASVLDCVAHSAGRRAGVHAE